jgi:hypothetical protein
MIDEECSTIVKIEKRSWIYNAVYLEMTAVIFRLNNAK